MNDREKVQSLRDIDDNKHIDEFDDGVEVIEFDDWKKRDNPEYYSSYLSMLSRLYDKEFQHGERAAELSAQCEMSESIDIWIERGYQCTDTLLAEIHACNDYLYGEDPFGDNYES